MTVAAIRPPVHTLDSAARDCIEASKGDRECATALLAKAIEEDANLRRDIADSAVLRGLQAAVATAVHHQRREFWQASSAQGAELSGRQLRATARAGLYAYPLSCGVQLGDATRQQLEDEQAMHRHQADANVQRARWYSSILERMPAKTKAPVRKHLTEADLQALLDSVKAAA